MNLSFKFIFHIIFRLIDYLVPKNDKVLVFGSRGAEEYFDNSRYLYEYCLASDGEWEPYWVTKRTKYSGSHGNELIVGSLQYYKILFRARYVFVSYGMYDIGHVRFSSRTHVTQLWHGWPLKNIFIKTQGIGFSQRLRFFYELKNYDYFVACDSLDQSNIVGCTGLESEKVPVLGYPRHDHLTSGVIENKCLVSFFDQYDKVVLFAPTFRDQKKSLFDFIKNFEWNKLIGYFERNKYLLVVRVHEVEFSNLVANESRRDLYKRFEDSDNVFFADNNNYPDVQDLLIGADLLISDYSGLIYDYSLISNNIIRFCPDIKDYREQRGLLDEFESLRLGLICRDFEELYCAVSDSLRSSAEKSFIATNNCKRIMNFISSVDGNG